MGATPTMARHGKTQPFSFRLTPSFYPQLSLHLEKKSLSTNHNIIEGENVDSEIKA